MPTTGPVRTPKSATPTTESVRTPKLERSGSGTARSAKERHPHVPWGGATRVRDIVDAVRWRPAATEGPTDGDNNEDKYESARDFVLSVRAATGAGVTKYKFVAVRATIGAVRVKGRSSPMFGVYFSTSARCGSAAVGKGKYGEGPGQAGQKGRRAARLPTRLAIVSICQCLASPESCDALPVSLLHMALESKTSDGAIMAERKWRRAAVVNLPSVPGPGECPWHGCARNVP